MAKLQLVLTRQEELELLAAQNEEIRENPAYGLELLQKAGIYDANGELTEHYRSDPQNEDSQDEEPPSES